MLEFYFNNYFSNPNNYNWVSIIFNIVTSIGIISAIIFSLKNYKIYANSNKTDALIKQISLENEVKNNYINFKSSSENYNNYKKSISTENTTDITTYNKIALEKDNAFELYMFSLDKLASLINSKYFREQFKKENRDWKSEYYETFKKAIEIYDNDDMIIDGKIEMVRNMRLLLQKWSNNH